MFKHNVVKHADQPHGIGSKASGIAPGSCCCGESKVAETEHGEAEIAGEE